MVQEIDWSSKKITRKQRLFGSGKRGLSHLDRMSVGVIKPRYSTVPSPPVAQDADVDFEQIDEEDHGTGPAHGILLALAISAVMWGALWLAVDLVFG